MGIVYQYTYLDRRTNGIFSQEVASKAMAGYGYSHSDTYAWERRLHWWPRLESSKLSNFCCVAVPGKGINLKYRKHNVFKPIK